MAQSSLRNNKRLFSVSGGDPSLPDRVTYLENNEYKILYFQTISAATGTITKPTNSTILLDQFYEGGDAIVETLVNGQPSGQSPLTAGGAVVSVSSFDTSGNFTLSGTPTSFDVALVYILKIKAEDYQNLTIANIMAMEDLNPITQTITNGDTSHAPSSDAVYNALALKKSSYYLNGALTGSHAAPADSTTYYYLIKGVGAQLSVSTYGQSFLTTGTITTVAVHALHSNNPTSESVKIYLRNDTTATDYTITLAWNDSYGASSSKSVIYTGLSIPVGNTTDKWVIKIITPAWVTNPTNWQWAWDFLIE